MSIIVYDVEVLRGPQDVEGGWNNPEAMGFGTAVAYNYSEDRYYFFNQDQKQDLIKMFTKNKIVSFNGIKFDNSVVLGNSYTKLWTDYDILLEVVKAKFGVSSVKEAEEKVGNATVHDGSCSLDGLSQGTLGLSKTGHGAKAPELIREGKWSDVYAYNLNDVRLTRKLYDFIRKYGYVVDKNGTKIKVGG